MKLPITVQDLVDLCTANGMNPCAVAVLTRAPCMTGNDEVDFLLNPQIIRDTQALNLEDEFAKVPVGITLDHADIHFDWGD